MKNEMISEEIRRGLKIMRSLKPLNEEIDNGGMDSGSIPYTNNDDLLASITQACKGNFGADFSNNKSPMVYYPNEKDVVVTGTIPTLDNATFRFSFNGTKGKGCELTANPIILDDNKLRIVNVIYGTYKNWVEELKKSEDIKPMSLRGKDEGGNMNAAQPSNDNNNTINNNITPGDDLD